MKNYVYADGYGHISEGLSAKEIKADEATHGELQFMKRDDGRIVKVNASIEHPSLYHNDKMKLSEFAHGDNESLVIEYSDSRTCRKRSMCLRKWLVQNGFIREIEMHKRKENLFFERIKK